MIAAAAPSWRLDIYYIDIYIKTWKSTHDWAVAAAATTRGGGERERKTYKERRAGRSAGGRKGGKGR